jgi:acetolactate synthase I/II/III large subunit
MMGEQIQNTATFLATASETSFFYNSLVKRAVADKERPLAEIVSSIFEIGGKYDGLAIAVLARQDSSMLSELLAKALGRDGDEIKVALKLYVSEAVESDFALTGAETVALLLQDAEVQVAFGYPGTSELATCDALGRMANIRLINSRGDKECAFMAAGASLLKPGSAVGVIHGARGLTNAAGAIADARRNEVGSIFVVGLPSTGSAQFLPPHGEDRLIESMGNFSKWTYEAGPVATSLQDKRIQARAFIEAVRDAVRHARTKPCGPVLVGLPQDVAEAKWIAWSQLASNSSHVLPNASSPWKKDVWGLATLIASHSRPLVLLDDYFLKYDGAQEALAGFVERIGAPVLQLRYRRGPMLFERVNPRKVPSFLGWLNPGDDDHRRLLAEADLLITLEDRNLYRRVVGELPACRKLAINSDARKVVKNQYLSEGDRLVEGDAVEILLSISQALEVKEQSRKTWFERRHHPSSENASVPADALYIRSSIVDALSEAMRSVANPVIVDDSQMFGGLISTEYDRLPDNVRVFGDHGGFVGGGLAYATGLAVADESLRVFCLLGDQGFTNAIQGLVAAKQEDARVTYIVCNNGESVSLLTQAAASYPRSFDGGDHPFLKNLKGFEYADLARGFGIEAFVVEFPRDGSREDATGAISLLRKVLKVAVSLAGPTLIELRLPARGAFWTGIWLTSGFEEAKGAPPAKVVAG